MLEEVCCIRLGMMKMKEHTLTGKLRLGRQIAMLDMGWDASSAQKGRGAVALSETGEPGMLLVLDSGHGHGPWIRLAGRGADPTAPKTCLINPKIFHPHPREPA